MPVQINEMVIRANIRESQANEANETNTRTLPGMTDKDINEIIQECAAVVMEIINNKNQR
jgi:hypothetical protein